MEKIIKSRYFPFYLALGFYIAAILIFSAISGPKIAMAAYSDGTSFSIGVAQQQLACAERNNANPGSCPEQEGWFPHGVGGSSSLVLVVI